MNTIQEFRVRVIGHRRVLDFFDRQQAAGRIPQALLLTGPPGIGKSTVARYFAQSLNCSDTTRPCGRCLSCRKVASGNHPDVRIFDSEDTTLKIDEIRDLQRELSLSPNEGRYRLALLCNFERATLSAANALLKTLEEPASQVVLILTASDPAALLPTIVSRCQVLSLRPLPAAEIAQALQMNWQVSPPQAELLAQLSAGRLGWAVRALADSKLLERRDHHLQDLIAVLSMNRVERLAYAQALSRDPVELRETLTLWLTFWHDLLLLQSGSQTRLTNLDWQEPLQHLARHISVTLAADTVGRLRNALLNLDRNVNFRLNLEVLLLKLPVLAQGHLLHTAS